MRSFIILSAALALASCTGSRPDAPDAKHEQVGQITEVRTIDYNCIAAEKQDADPFDTVNRISLDLVNNRIDMFSKNKMWQFHGVETSEIERHAINIAFIGKNVAVWGIDRSNPYTFFFDRVNRKIIFSVTKIGRVQSVSYDC